MAEWVKELIFGCLKHSKFGFSFSVFPVPLTTAREWVRE